MEPTFVQVEAVRREGSEFAVPKSLCGLNQLGVNVPIPPTTSQGQMRREFSTFWGEIQFDHLFVHIGCQLFHSLRGNTHPQHPRSLYIREEAYTGNKNFESGSPNPSKSVFYGSQRSWRYFTQELQCQM